MDRRLATPHFRGASPGGGHRRELGLGFGLACLSLAGSRAPTAPPSELCMYARPWGEGEGGSERWAGRHDGPGRAFPTQPSRRAWAGVAKPLCLPSGMGKGA